MSTNAGFSSDFLSLPFLGELSPGQHLDKEKIITQINIPNYLHVSHNCFVLRMSGTKMQDSGIFHNDLLIIEPSSTAKNGAIVIATIDNLETVIKHFEQTNDLIILSCKSPDIKPMIFDPSRIKIAGILVSQMRSY